MAFVRDVEVHAEGGHMDRIRVQPSETTALELLVHKIVYLPCTVSVLCVLCMGSSMYVCDSHCKFYHVIGDEP